MTTVTYTTTNAAGAEVDARAGRYMERNGSSSYQEAVQLAEAYAAPAVRVTPRRLGPRTQAPAPVRAAQGIPSGAIVDRRAKELTETDPELSYAQAVHRVLDQDPALKTAYAGV